MEGTKEAICEALFIIKESPFFQELFSSLGRTRHGLISFRMDWLDLFAVQGTLKSLLQHHSSKASILHSAFFIVQLSHPYMTTGKTISLTLKAYFTLFLKGAFNHIMAI